MKKILLAALAIAVLWMAGCKDPYGGCVKAGAAIGVSIGQGMNTVANLQQQGLISATEAINIISYLEYANKADEAFLTCVATAHTSGSKAGSFTGCATVFNVTLNSPSALLLIKVNNPGASQTISTVVNAVTTGVTAVEATLGGQ